MSVNVKMGVDLGGFTAGIREGQNVLKGLNAEMKATEAEFKATGNAEQMLANKTKTLTSQLNVQKGIADAAQAALQKMAAAGVVVMNTPGQNSNAVAELALGLMIFMARTHFTPATGSELQGKRLGVQAYGNVGRLVGQKAKALGMAITALDPFLTDEQIVAGGAEPVHSVEELYATSDYLSIHIPALPSTIKSIGYDLLMSMPKGATVVNTARKEVIDEDGLLKALEEREDLKYVTDVMPDNYDKLTKNFGYRVFATPKKMGAQTSEANVNAGLAAARQIADFFATGNTRFQVNK